MPLRDPAVQAAVEVALVAHDLHMRVGQLLVNVFADGMEDNVRDSNLFYLEDEVLLQKVRDYYEQQRPRPSPVIHVPRDPDAS